MPKRKSKTKTSEKIILVRYGEIFLKSEPVKRMYTKRLKENIKAGFKEAKIKSEIIKTRGRIFIKVSASKIEKACSVLERTFGVVSFSFCYHLESSKIKDIQKFVKANYVGWVPRRRTFAIRARRVGSQKEKYTSMLLAKKIGDVVNRKANLSNPDVEIFVEVRGNDSYIYTSVIKGPGGMPVGTAGSVVCLLSGGIDSPVAAWLMMKRGCRVIALYADNWPYVGNKEKSMKRTVDVLKVLQSWSTGWKIPAFSFDHGKNLKKFSESKDVPEKFVCLLCKRMMYRVANELAWKWNAKAVVTGETLGEVASQTLDNLAVLDKASELPVFRPLIGNDKQDNVDIAKRIGTYEKSISVAGKCGVVPSSPRTKGKISEIKSIESKLPMKKLLQESVKSIKSMKS